jgi:hypothetical protein
VLDHLRASYPLDLDVGHGYVWVGVGAEPFDFGFPVCN